MEPKWEPKSSKVASEGISKNDAKIASKRSPKWFQNGEAFFYKNDLLASQEVSFLPFRIFRHPLRASRGRFAPKS